MSKPILHYFDLAGGRGDPIRAILRVGNVDFEDRRLDYAGFLAFKKQNPGLGQLPVIEVAGKMVGQTQAVARYAARLAKLYPEDPFAAAQVDEVFSDCEELLTGIMVSGNHSGSHFRKAREEINTEYAPWILKEFERRLEANRSGVFVGDSITAADIFAVLTMEFAFKSGFFDFLRTDVFDPYPKYLALVNKVQALPAIVELRKQHPRFQKYKLYYYNLPARAEHIRLAFAIGGVPFEDVRFGFGEKPPVETPYAWPMLTIEEMTGISKVVESEAILRYAGKLTRMYPEDPYAALKVDECLQLVEECFTGPNNVSKFWSTPDSEKRSVVEKWATTEAPYIFKRLEETAALNKEHGFLVGDTMSIADLSFTVYYGLLVNVIGAKDFLPVCPNLDIVRAKVDAHPKVVQYRANLK